MKDVLGEDCFTDDYYEHPKLSREELLEISKRDVQKDILKMAFFHRKMISTYSSTDGANLMIGNFRPYLRILIVSATYT